MFNVFDRERLVRNIKELCKIKGLYPTVVCKESGVGPSFINDLERGKTPSVSKVQMLASYLGVTTSELLGEVYIKQETEEVLPKNVQGTHAKISPAAEQVAMAYDQASPELRNAARRVLGLKEEPPAASNKAM